VKIVKNKVAPPFKQAEFDIMYGTGISREGDMLDCAVEAKIVEKAGAWYSFNGERIGQGRENVKNYLREHPEMLQEIETLLKQELIPNNIKVDEDGVIVE
jgi:recombination protein RecA